MPTYLVWSGGDNTLGTEAGGWAAAATSIPALLTLITSVVGGDIIKVHKTHSYVPGATNTWTLPETGTGMVTVICVDKDASDAPSTGAVEGTTGAFALVLSSSTSNCGMHIQGLILRAGIGSTSGTADITISSNPNLVTFTDCVIDLASNVNTAEFLIGATTGSTGGVYRFIRCVFKFANTGGTLVPNGGVVEFYNCSIDPAGASPTVLFEFIANSRCTIRCYGCDWSHAAAMFSRAITGVKELYFYNCVIDTLASTGVEPAVIVSRVEMHASGPAGANADTLKYYYEESAGNIVDDQAAYLTTGGAVGVQSTGAETPYSLKMSPTVYCSKVQPLWTPWFYKFVESTGSKTVTMKVAHLEAAPLKTSELFMEVMYQGEPGLAGTQRTTNSTHSLVELDDDCPLVSGTLGRNVLAAGSDRTDTSASWTGITPTETNTLTASISVDVIGYVWCRIGLALDLPSASAAGVLYVDPKVNVVSA